MLGTGIIVGMLAAAGVNSPTAEVRQIYQRLCRVATDGRRAPALVIRTEPGPFVVAYYDQAGRTINIDDRVVRYCFAKPEPLNRDCVAFFLGHELAHFYKDHTWGTDFPAAFSAAVAPAPGLTAEQRGAFEAQADQAGGLYAHLAGYAALPSAPDILTDIYKLYGLPQNIPGYPSLEQRKQIAQAAQADLTRMTPVFDLGILLFVLERFDESSRCFDWIAQSFPSREILSDAALAKALEAAALFPKERQATRYPWTLDGQTRLDSRAETPRGQETEAPPERRARLLAEAEDGFTSALRRDPDYAVALLNLALVEDLRGQYGSAADHAAQARALAAKSGAAALVELCRTAQAIVALHAGSLSKAAGWPPAAVPKRALAKAAPIDVDLPAPSTIRFANDPGESVVIAPVTEEQAAIEIAFKKTVDFEAMRMRSGAARLFVIGGTAEHVPEPLRHWHPSAGASRPTAFGTLDYYARERLLVYRDGPRILRWMSFEWAE